LPDFSGHLIAQVLAIEPSPTFPFLESQCQRAQLGANFHLAREALPLARPCLTSGVGGVYRRVNLLCQIRIDANFAFFRTASEKASHTLAACANARRRAAYGRHLHLIKHVPHRSGQCPDLLCAFCDRPSAEPGSSGVLALSASARGGGHGEPVPRFALFGA